MAWEAGLTYNAELRDALRDKLETKPVGWLAEALANDKWARVFTGLPNSKAANAFERYRAAYANLPHDVLVELAMDTATETDTTDNGGFAVWIDKTGCSRVEV